MSKSFTTSGLSAYLEDNIAQIEKVRKEVEEIQVGFQSAYGEWRIKHDAELAALSVALFVHPAEIGAELQAKINLQQIDERKIIEQRRKELSETILPKHQEELDKTLARGQTKTGELRKLNPELNQKEENLKSNLAQTQHELTALNQQIQQRSRRLGGIFHFGEINKLDRQRQRLIGRMEEQQESLRKVRQEWAELHQVALQEQSELQEHWQQVVADQAQRQAELNYLDEEQNRQRVSLERAVWNVLDNLKDPIACPSAELQAALDKMITYNHQTDDYQQGLAAVGGLIGMLGSIQEGMRRFNTSVQALTEQERANSQYLKPLQIVVSDAALAFNQQWDDLYKKVLDEKSICAHPAEFTHAMQPVTETQLSVARLTGMFDSLGDSLKKATANWK